MTEIVAQNMEIVDTVVVERASISAVVSDVGERFSQLIEHINSYSTDSQFHDPFTFQYRVDAIGSGLSMGGETAIVIQCYDLFSRQQYVTTIVADNMYNGIIIIEKQINSDSSDIVHTFELLYENVGDFRADIQITRANLKHYV